MNSKMAALAADTQLSKLCVGLVDLTDSPANPPYAGLNDQEMLFVGSLDKTAAMYTAFELRSRVRAQVAAEVAAGLSTTASHWEAPVLAKLEKTWKPIFRKAFPKLPEGMPNWASIFSFDSSGGVDFAATSPALSAADIDKIGEFGKPRGAYADWLKQMMHWSNDASASRCIRPLSFPFINGTLASAGFFDTSANAGLWVSGDYESHDWIAGAGNRAGQSLAARWQKTQNRARSNFAATAFQVARLLTLLATDKLIDATSSQEMRVLMESSSGHGMVPFVKRALRSDERKVKSIFAKLGLGDDNSSHDCAVVERTVSGNTLRYVLVVLGDMTDDNSDLFKLVLACDDIIQALH
jgi:hypothetical protein